MNGGAVAGTRAPSRALVALVAVGMLVAAAVVPAARAEDGRLRGWVLTRQGTANRPIEGTFEWTATSDESFVALYALAGRGARRGLDHRFGTTWVQTGGDPWAQFHVGDVENPPCPAACQVPLSRRTTTWVSSQRRAIASTVYVVAYDVFDPVLSITSPGWTVKPFRPSLRFLTWTEGGEGVVAGHTAAGMFQGGELAGGSHGSAAWAVLPCGERDVGSGTLSGGRYQWPMKCSGGHTALDEVPGKTRWRFEAEVIGKSSASTPLLVIDFPPG